MDLSAVLSGSHSSLPSKWEVLGLSPSSSFISGSTAMHGHSSWSDTLRHGNSNLNCASVNVLVSQWCPTLCNPMDCSPPGSSVHRVLQARILEWVAFPFSRGSSKPRGRTQVSCTAGRFITTSTTWEAPYQGWSGMLVTQSCQTLCDPIDCSLPGSSVHGIFQAIVLEWIAISFSRARTRVSHIVDRRYTVWATREIWATREAQIYQGCILSIRLTAIDIDFHHWMHRVCQVYPYWSYYTAWT